MALTIDPKTRPAPLPQDERNAIAAELAGMRGAFAAAKAADALEAAGADEKTRAAALANVNFSPAPPKVPEKATRYTVVLRTPLPSAAGPVPAMRADKVTWDRAGVWLRIDGGDGRVFVPYNNIGCLQDDQ